MNERTIWIVRIVGVAVILLLFFLLMNLHARLVRLNQQQSPRPQKTTGSLGATVTDAWAERSVNA